MNESFHLESYLTKGVEKIVKGALRASLSNPGESLFMAKYALSSKRSSALRKKAEESGEHIPPFLIASITSRCNLYCEGCYARANDSCRDTETPEQLTAGEWTAIFEEAGNLGVGFILLAGGEPLIRRDVIEAAGQFPEILFPVFTNGILMDESWIRLFESCRNLVPVLSIEGGEKETNQRRGDGIYLKLLQAMNLLQSGGILFGASITVTRENVREVSSPEFLDNLQAQGCRVVIFVEYVPVTEDTRELAPGDEERKYLRKSVDMIRGRDGDMLFISFPGDEKSSGGCLAAGRGFFHINSQGGAEPCPFSPYSDINVRDTSLKQALHSRLFESLRTGNVLTEEHSGGCVLFEKKSLVETLLGREN